MCWVLALGTKGGISNRRFLPLTQNSSLPAGLPLPPKWVGVQRELAAELQHCASTSTRLSWLNGFKDSLED